MSPSLTTNSKIVPLEWEAISITDTVECDHLLLIRGNNAIIYFIALLLDGISEITHALISHDQFH